MIDALFAVAIWCFLFYTLRRQPVGKGEGAPMPSAVKAAVLATLLTVLVAGLSYAKFGLSR